MANGTTEWHPSPESFTPWYVLPIQNRAEITTRSVISTPESPHGDCWKEIQVSEMMNQNWVSHTVTKGSEPEHGKRRAGEHFSSSSHLPKTKGIHSRLIPRSPWNNHEDFFANLCVLHNTLISTNYLFAAMIFSAHALFSSNLRQPFLLHCYPTNHSTNIAHWVVVPRAQIQTENLTLSSGPCCISRCHGHSNSQIRELRTNSPLLFTILGRDSIAYVFLIAITLLSTSIRERQSHVESWHFFSTEMVHLQLLFF